MVLRAFSHGAIALSGTFKTNSMEASDWLFKDILQSNFWQKYESHQNRTHHVKEHQKPDSKQASKAWLLFVEATLC